jgi:hypothetical protein
MMDAMLALKQEDRKLRIGSPVTVFWRAHGYRFRSRGRVSRLQRLEADVRLLVPIPAGRDYPRIQAVTVPRISCSAAWSSSCCLRLERR